MYYMEDLLVLRSNNNVRLTLSYMPNTWNSNRSSKPIKNQLDDAEKLLKKALKEIESMREEN